MYNNQDHGAVETRWIKLNIQHETVWTERKWQVEFNIFFYFCRLSITIDVLWLVSYGAEEGKRRPRTYR